MTAFETVVGLEVHVQLATRTKMFSGATCVFGQEPNTQVEPVSLGLPGSLPVVNGRAVRLAARAALALDCTVHERSTFDRKHYFYPDLPKGYQISQYDEPYCTGGRIPAVAPDGADWSVPLTRIHMEEDAGKLIHGGAASQVDLNRAGTPLIEIVTEPDIRSAQQAHACLLELKRTLKACGVSDCEMQEGSLRCDANVSVRPVGATVLGTKVEIKNLNSFRAVEAAITHEAEQQIALHRAGRAAEIVQATKLWDPERKVTLTMRTKEGAADYRYFPDPDLPPLHLDAAFLAEVRADLPELPRVREARFVNDLGVKPDAAAELTQEVEVADYFEALVAAGCEARSAANWTREEALRLAGVRKLPIAQAAPVAAMAELVKLVDEGRVARVVAKADCDELFATGQAPTQFFTAAGKLLASDTGELPRWVAEAITAQPQAAAEVKAGNQKAVGRIVGEAMKRSGGKANPKLLTPEILRQLAG